MTDDMPDTPDTNRGRDFPKAKGGYISEPPPEDAKRRGQLGRTLKALRPLIEPYTRGYDLFGRLQQFAGPPRKDLARLIKRAVKLGYPPRQIPYRAWEAAGLEPPPGLPKDSTGGFVAPHKRSRDDTRDW